MSVALDGAKNAVLQSLAELGSFSDETKAAFEKLNIKELLSLIKDIKNLPTAGFFINGTKV